MSACLKGKKKRLSICWFTVQMPATARAPTPKAGALLLELCLAAPCQDVLAKAGVRSRAGRFCTAHTAESDPPERCPTIQQCTLSGSVAHMIKTETREMTTKQCMDL